MTPQENLTAIVLAGGKSSRMGEDKALIPIHGVPLLQLVCRVAKACADTVYVVTPWPERYQDIVPSGCEFICEVPMPRETGNELTSSTKESFPLAHGPLVGFAQGLTQVQTDWVLLLACDLPKLRVEVLQEWATGLDGVSDEVIAVLTHHARGWDPLCGFYRRSCLAELRDFMNPGGRSFQRWLQQHPVQVLPLPDAGMLFNCNTPEDLAVLRGDEGSTEARRTQRG